MLGWHATSARAEGRRTSVAAAHWRLAYEVNFPQIMLVLQIARRKMTRKYDNPSSYVLAKKHHKHYCDTVNDGLTECGALPSDTKD